MVEASPKERPTQKVGLPNSLMVSRSLVNWESFVGKELGAGYVKGNFHQHHIKSIARLNSH